MRPSYLLVVAVPAAVAVTVAGVVAFALALLVVDGGRCGRNLGGDGGDRLGRGRRDRQRQQRRVVVALPLAVLLVVALRLPLALFGVVLLLRGDRERREAGCCRGSGRGRRSR